MKIYVITWSFIDISWHLYFSFLSLNIRVRFHNHEREREGEGGRERERVREREMPLREQSMQNSGNLIKIRIWKLTHFTKKFVHLVTQNIFHSLTPSLSHYGINAIKLFSCYWGLHRKPTIWVFYEPLKIFVLCSILSTLIGSNICKYHTANQNALNEHCAILHWRWWF